MAVLATVTLGQAFAAAQAPQVQNGRVEIRTVTSLDGAVAAAGTRVDPAWIGWSVPLVRGDRNLCSQWTPDVGTTIRGVTLEAAAAPAARPTAPPVRLEGGNTLVVLARIVSGRVERLRTVDDECPVDAGGQTLVWLTGVSPAESVRYLDGLLREAMTTTDGQRRLATTIVTAIALHRDPAADAPLDRLVAPGALESMARHTATWIGATRGAHGFATLQTRIRAERDPQLRRALVRALGQTREAATPDALITIARTDTDPGVRAEAVHWYAVRTPDTAIAGVMSLMAQDTDDQVKRRAVSSLGLLPADAAVPALIQLARSGPSPVIRKEAVSTLGQSTDARARAFLEELVTR
jgi:hypothetical protein